MAPVSPTALMLDNRASATDIVDVPVLVPIDRSIVDYAQIVDRNTDLGLRAAATGVDLPTEIVTWNPDGESLVWTRVPVVAAGSFEDAILVHFGPGANRADPGASPWDGFDLVVEDAAHTAATLSDVTSSPAWIGNGLTFPSTRTGTVRFPPSTLMSGWSQFSLSMWIFAARPSAQTEYFTLDNGLGAQLGRYYPLVGAPEVVQFQIDFHFDTGDVGYVAVPIEPEAWTQLAYTFDGKVLRAYRDGTFAAIFAASKTTTLQTGVGTLQLGRPGGDGFSGQIDEFRISQRFSSKDLIRAQYLSESRGLLRTR